MSIDKNSIKHSVETLFQPDDTIEVRCVGDGRPISGFFRDQAKLLEDVLQLNTDDNLLRNVYVCLNPVQPEFFAKRPDECGKANRGDCVRDHEVECRRWLLVDLDAVRLSGLSATDDEKQAASDLAERVDGWLVERLGSDCLVRADSGNGEHIIIRLPDVPASNESRWVCENFLKMLSEKFDTEGAVVDKTTFNAARICTLYGTVKRKGEATQERPHRASGLIHVPDPLTPVDWEKMAALVEPYPGDRPIQQVVTAPVSDGNSWDVRQLLEDRNIVYMSNDEYGTHSGEPATLYELEVCPFNAEHNDRSAHITQWQSGAVSFGCHHNGCGEKNWASLKQLWKLPASSGITVDDIIMPTQPTVQQGNRSKELQLRSISTVDVEPARWLWEPWVPFGKLTVLAGNGEVGKTTLCCDIAAMISNGARLPGSGDDVEPVTGTTIFISDEEDEADIASRVAAAGGNPEKLLVLAENEVFDTYQADVPRLKAAIERLGDVVLIIFDTLPDFLGAFDDHQNSGVRQSLRSLIRLARDTDIAVVGLCHFNKNSQGASSNRLLGSVAYRNLPRSVLFLLQDPDNERRRVLFHEKSNLAPKADPLAFSLQGSPNGSVHVVWEQGICIVDDIRRYFGSEPPATAKRNTAADWLLGPFGLGAGPKTPSQVLADAEQAGIAKRTLQRAATEMGVLKTREAWTLPGVEGGQDDDVPIDQVEE